MNYAQLSNQELLGLVIAESSAATVLTSLGSLEEALMHSEPNELRHLKGLRKEQALRLKAVAEISRRLYERPLPLGTTIRTPADVFQATRDMQLLKQEHIRVICLNTKNKVLCSRTIIIGGVDRGIVEPREVYHLPVKLLAKSVIVVHNHPSGDPAPSQNDIELTHRLKEAGELLAIHLLDHVIIGKGQYRSLKEADHI